MNKKKVAFITTPIGKGGIGLYSKGLYDALENINDNDIEIEKIEVDYKSKSVKIGSKINFVKSILGVNSVFYAYFALKKLKIQEKYDLFYFTSQSLSFVPLSPKVLTCHDLINLNFPATFLSRFSGPIYYSGLKKCKHLISASDFTKKDIIDKYFIEEHKISTIYQGISDGFRVINKSKELIRKEKNFDVDTWYLIYIGSEEKRKNFVNILRALKEVNDTFDAKVELLKVGKPSSKGNRKLIVDVMMELQIENKVHFLEELSSESLVEYLNLADLMVFPSLYEGFGRPPLEAMACGLPVVSSNLTSLPEVVGEAACLVDAYSVKDIARGIILVLSDDSYRASLVKKGFENIKRFNWEKVGQEVMNIFKEVINE